jgi:hypothetical protein
MKQIRVAGRQAQSKCPLEVSLFLEIRNLASGAGLQEALV